jgi:formamidopyrimidine-DNA glycosylase
MPELPEVETIARMLKPQLEGRTIQSTRLLWKRTLASPSPKMFASRIAGQKILNVGRRAKFLQFQLSKDHLFIHLRMSGDLFVKGPRYEPAKHDRLLINLSGGKSLVFNDTRKFGRVWLTDNPEEVIGNLGPEPFDPAFTPHVLYSRMQSRHRQIKPLLLDQSFLAGMGNIYTDEALHLAGIHPLSESDKISLKKAEKLFDAIRTVLEAGIEHNGATIDWVYRGGGFQNYFRVYGRTGEPCPVCRTTIERITVGQRGTHFCPRCQRRLNKE